MSMWDIDAGHVLWSRSGPSDGNGIFSAERRHYRSQPNWYLWSLWDVVRGERLFAVVTPSRAAYQQRLLTPSCALARCTADLAVGARFRRSTGMMTDVRPTRDSSSAPIPTPPRRTERHLLREVMGRLFLFSHR